ncbi:hypothetical protein TPHA_0H02290 [Tetrapisispora phaffii CBS 4417]|uniref:CobW/HypB/UreG nucleotide-binding domain-containing protein n=1 Tax=Tetrapisispora phaffii (strain ATCC 24235 / CBS 4417 / NBRC 1672 / NRRL Y-8282 / UCD 70-5) TaxID=1071381 RepID=G8BWI2_TETPH|nr:hypothetical protein TPHA_0H02290 [Tetrapisispora phaffii CBS 4417]CCE64433.1 hypothetical protein TPHA_0H02290 [Tetrapisispora phaffii CBS 4417]
MSALKNFAYKEDEDGELPTLVTGQESNIKSILENTKNDVTTSFVSDAKMERANKQVEDEEIIKQKANRANDELQDAQKLESVTKKIPVSVITGYLGSGKSTLLEQIALKGSDKKIAVILNEFGDSSEIEKAMKIRNGSSAYEEWLDLGNGCLCCSLKNVGVKAIEDMVLRSPGKIDYILLETSGIADPAPIAKMFWQDEGLNSCVYLDGIITVLDAENILKCLDDVSPDTHWHGEKVLMENNLTIAHFQIAMADRILLNKMDRVEGSPDSSETVKVLEDRIRQINAVAPIYHTKYGDTALEYLLDIHAYDNSVINETNIYEELKMSRPTLHDPRMNTVALTFRPLKNEEEYSHFLKNFLQPLLWRFVGVTDEPANFKSHYNDDDEWEVQRTKGLIIIEHLKTDSTAVKIIQGVRETYDITDGELRPGIAECKLVFIGKYLEKTYFESLLKKVLG